MEGWSVQVSRATFKSTQHFFTKDKTIIIFHKFDIGRANSTDRSLNRFDRTVASRRGSRIGRQLPASGIVAGNSEQSALSCGRSFLGCYRLNGSSLRSAPYDLLHRIALSPSTTHRRWRRGNVGYTTVGKTQRKKERERERTRAAKETARPRWKDVYTAQQRKEARSLCPTESPRSVALDRIKS